MTAEHRSHVFKVLTLLIFLGGCSSTTKSANTTAATFPAVTTVTKLTTTAPAPATTFEHTTSVTPITLATVTTKAPSTTKPKTTSTTFPQLQLSGTPEDQISQVKSAVAGVAAISGNFKAWSSKLYQLNQSVSSYGIKVVWDPNDVGKDIYQISINLQSACFLWTYKDASVSTDKYLQPHSC